MKEIKLMYIGVCCILIVTVMIFYLMLSPYKLIGKLPKISANQVERVVAWESRNMDKNLLEDGQFDLNSLITWYNQSKELKTEIGTTPDCAIEIYLKDKSKISIWTLYSPKWVTIGYKDKDGSYYQTNVSSRDLAGFTAKIRKDTGLD